MERPKTPTRAATSNVVVPGETTEQKLARAKGYPYPRPDTSFLFVAGEVFEFANSEWRGLAHLHAIKGRCGTQSAAFAASCGVDDLAALGREEMWPVLAIGSNAGPEQLRRKYPAEAFPGCVVPVIQIDLEDFDVVYTPYIATYGSCTATLEHSPGATVRIFITYLTAPLMERMHATEGGYNLTRLSGLRLHVAPTAAATAAAAGTSGGGSSNGGRGSSFEVLGSVYQYNHKLGCIALPLLPALPTAGSSSSSPVDSSSSSPVDSSSSSPVDSSSSSPVAITDIPATGRAFPAATQQQMLAALRAALGGGGGGWSGGDGRAETDVGSGGGAAPLRPVDLAAAGLPAAQAGLDGWILDLVNGPDQGALREAVCSRLEVHARPFAYAQSEVVAAL